MWGRGQDIGASRNSALGMFAVGSVQDQKWGRGVAQGPYPRGVRGEAGVTECCKALQERGHQPQQLRGCAVRHWQHAKRNAKDGRIMKLRHSTPQLKP